MKDDTNNYKYIFNDDDGKSQFCNNNKEVKFNTVLHVITFVIIQNYHYFNGDKE